MANLPESATEAKRVFDIPSGTLYLQRVGLTAATQWTLRGLITSGTVASFKVHGRYYVAREELDRWLERVSRQRRRS